MGHSDRFSPYLFELYPNTPPVMPVVKDKGFTLIEVLMALGILTIALGALVKGLVILPL
uniref:Prepilin-type N-terminal cleavage/methylation domain-containing protein n=2 Tax=Candidatus Kentrum sp. TC TaxID=2126339 RepID=A0A451A525_9GAMM|nr:MAG: prepilin-type N-terminal cleavage/methylation domain-containing protein [Candidatus Kentron sp. TC]